LEADKNIYYRDSAGTSHSIVELQDADDTCKIGFTTSPAIDGHLLMFADGTERMRIDPTGTVIVGNPAFPGGLTAKVSAALQIESTTQGFYPPRMTTTQKNAISPQAGCVVYDITIGGLSFYDGIGWITAVA